MGAQELAKFVWRQQWLFDFGKKNNYPGIAFRSEATGMKYTMGYDGDKDIWDMQVAGGNEDYINAAYLYLQSSVEEEL